ncbi:ATP-binding protein [Streptomyces sp. CBMA156]|uniref:ATP-binding protein n=1 Tax=Streptomyces sp. CBMA156 TaxID=1930280 RepID=UPI001661DA9A|nr:ATP-binding protein [Streptomyces sp. CBMA156]
MRTGLPLVVQAAEDIETLPVPDRWEPGPGTEPAVGQLTAALNRIRTAAALDVLFAVRPMLDVLVGQLPSGAGVSRLLLLSPPSAVMLRFAVRAAVLAGGGWPGLHGEAAPLGRIALAALAGVDGGDRVEVVVQCERTVAARAVEPLLAALAELADNALRASDGTGPVVVVTGQPAGRLLPVTVTDTGPGMDATTLARTQALLADRRGVYTASAAVPAGGLGLRLVAAAADTTGLDAVVDSAPGRGTTVRLLLPAHLLSDPSDPATCADPHTHTPAPH